VSEAVVLVDHGSRLQEASETLDAIARLLQERMPSRLVLIAHMELATPNLNDAIEVCAARGVKKIIVVPYFLTAGRHTRDDIPRLVREAAFAHPSLRLELCAPLGVHPRLVDVLLERIAEGARGDGRDIGEKQ